MSAEEGMLKPKKPPPKKAGRKKVAKKNLAHQPKCRGRYKPKQNAGAKDLALDVAECIFSDEEVFICLLLLRIFV